MKKILLLLSIMTIFLVYNKKEEYYTIPNEAIRLRIIANSNNMHDQYIKMRVKENLENILKETINTSSLNKARKSISSNIQLYNNNIENTLKTEKENINYKTNYGLNYFPEKTYKNIKYEEGYYESLVVTLGEGKGDNWWCVLFPPICVLEVEEAEEVEYHFFIKDIIEKYL